MTVILESGYTLPSGDLPLTHARVLHAENWMSDGTASGEATSTGFSESAPLNSLTYEYWKSDSTTGIWTYDPATPIECDCLCIAAHTIGSSASEVRLDYWDGSSWVVVLGHTAVADDGPIMVLFAPITATRWRLRFRNGTPPMLGVVRLGKALQMERPIYAGHGPVTLARETVLRSNFSETGEFLGRSKQRNMLATSFAWDRLSETWVRQNWPSLQRGIESEPFFIAWRPGDNQDVGFCQVNSVPKPSTMGVQNLMQVSMTVRGYLND